MSFYVEATSHREFKMVPPGTHLARCYRLVDLGTQTVDWQGQQKFQHKIMLGWEIHGEDDQGQPLVTDEGEPLAMFKNYTLSWSENATLRKDLQTWRGAPWSDDEAKRFNLQNILGQWCMVNVIHRAGENGKTYANIAGLSPVPAIIKKAGIPEGHNEIQIFRLNDPDWVLFETFSKGLKAKIEASPEYRSARGVQSAPAKAPAGSTGSGFDDIEDDMPF